MGRNSGQWDWGEPSRVWGQGQDEMRTQKGWEEEQDRVLWGLAWGEIDNGGGWDGDKIGMK